MFTPASLAIMLDQVEPERRTTASSIANLSFNCLGYLPAPVIYTQILSAYGGEEDRTGQSVAMAVILYSNGIGFICLVLAHMCRKKQAAAVEAPNVNTKARKKNDPSLVIESAVS